MCCDVLLAEAAEDLRRLDMLVSEQGRVGAVTPPV
jgi:hypothetical protein